MPSLRSSTGHRGVVANDPPAFAREVPDGPTGQLCASGIYDAGACCVSPHCNGRIFLREAARALLPVPAPSGRQRQFSSLVT